MLVLAVLLVAGPSWRTTVSTVGLMIFVGAAIRMSLKKNADSTQATIDANTLNSTLHVDSNADGGGGGEGD